MQNFSLFMPIAKVDVEKRMVWGYASTPALDLDNEIVDLEAVRKALPDYMEWRNIREMHQPSAVGVAKEASIDEKGLYLGAKVVDEAAWAKVQEDVYKGFSIGGDVTSREGNRITGINLIEISLVDRPANPECKIETWKSAKPLVGAVRLMPSDIVISAEDVGPLRKFFGLLFKGGSPEADKPAPKVDPVKPAVEKGAKAEALRKYLVEVCDAPCPIYGAYGPNKEISDAQQAINALWSICYLLDSEKDEGEDNNAAQVADLELVVDRLKTFIASEITEARAARKAATVVFLAKTAPVADPDGTSVIERIDAMFAAAQETDMTLDEARAIVAKRGATGAHAEHMTKGMHHLGKAMECQKSAHGHMGKAIAAHMDAMKTYKGVGVTKEADAGAHGQLSSALEHMHEAHGQMTEMAAHHELASHHFGKALGSAPAERTGEQQDPAWNGDTEVDVDPLAAAAKTGVDVNSLIKSAIESATEAAFAKGQLSAIAAMPRERKGAIFAVDKTIAAAGQAGAGDPKTALFNGITQEDTGDDATQKALTNMFANRGVFAKNVMGSGFAGQAVAKG